MSTELADLVEPPNPTRPLAQRVREALTLLPHVADALLDSTPEQPDYLVAIRGSARVALVSGTVFLRGGAVVEEAVAQATRGDAALIIVGTVPDALPTLLASAVYDVVDDHGPPARLALALRNAFDLLDLKERADNRARWVRRFRNEASALMETARALSTERDTNKLLGLILEKCREIALADAGSIYVVEGTDPDIEKRTLRFKLSQNESVAFASGEFVMPISMRSIAGAVAITRKITSLDDVYNLPADSPFAFDRRFDARVGYRTRSVLTVPLISAADEVIGVVQLINKKRDRRVKVASEADVLGQVVSFDERSIELVASLAAQAGVALENAMLYEEIRRIFDGFVRASVQAIEQRDPTTSGHSLRVSVLSCRLAEAVDRTDTGPYKDTRFSSQDIRVLEYASLLHDFGKIGVREQVLVKARKLYDPELRLIRLRFDYLHKALEAEFASRRADLFARNAPVGDLQALENEMAQRVGTIEGFWDVVREANEPTLLPQDVSDRIDDLAHHSFVDPRGGSHPWLSPEEVVSLKVARGSLTPDEIAEIRSHVSHTFEFLARIPWGKTFANVPMIAGCHHEKLNGKGYPRSLKGESIPVGSRVMAIADIFDALTASDRPYKKAVPVDKALAILGFEVKDGALDGELVRIFMDSGAYRSIGEDLRY